MAFIEVATIAEETPLELWAGWDGKGFDQSMFLATGERQGGTSTIFRHDDRLGDSHWVEELSAPDTETFNKIRDGLDPDTGERRLWVYNEGPEAGESWLAYRSLGSASWAFESIPFSGNAVGGRGLGVDGMTGAPIYAGGSQNWSTTKDGELYRRIAGSWSLFRSHSPGILWEVEFEPGGILWEFWNGFAGGPTPQTFRNGSAVTDPPGADISQAAWFPGSGHMYVTGDLSDSNPRVWRSSNGAAWSEVLNAGSGTGDHVVYVPRGAGELWATFHDPLKVYKSLDGSNWVNQGLPELDTDLDTNHLTALGYYCGRVWVASRHAGSGVIRIYRENIGSRCAGGMLQVI
jgi:hypothetical protein